MIGLDRGRLVALRGNDIDWGKRLFSEGRKTILSKPSESAEVLKAA